MELRKMIKEDKDEILDIYYEYMHKKTMFLHQ